MFIDYKYKNIFRLNDATIAEVLVYMGEYQDVEVEDFNFKTKEMERKIVSTYVRTTPMSEPLMEFTLTLPPDLSDEEVKKHVNAVIDDTVKEKKLAVDVLPTQATKPQQRREVAKEVTKDTL